VTSVSVTARPVVFTLAVGNDLRPRRCGDRRTGAERCGAEQKLPAIGHENIGIVLHSDILTPLSRGAGADVPR